MALRTLLFFGIALLSSCASSYRQPGAAESSATVTLVAEGHLIPNTWVYRYPGALDEHRCSAQPAEAIAILGNVSVLSQYADHGKNTRSVRFHVPANGQTFRIGIPILGGSPDYKPGATSWTAVLCNAHGEFTPEKGAVYVATYLRTQDGCALNIARLDASGAAEAEPTFRARPACFDSDNMHWSGAEASARKSYEQNPETYR